MISHDRSPLSLPLCKSGVVLFMVELYHGIPSMSIGFICIYLKFLFTVLEYNIENPMISFFIIYSCRKM